MSLARYHVLQENARRFLKTRRGEPSKRLAIAILEFLCDPSDSWTPIRDIHAQFLKNTKRVGRPPKNKGITKKPEIKTNHPNTIVRLLNDLVDFGLVERKDEIEKYARTSPDKTQTHPFYRIDRRVLVPPDVFAQTYTETYWAIADRIGKGGFTENDANKEIDRLNDSCHHYKRVLDGEGQCCLEEGKHEGNVRVLAIRYFCEYFRGIDREMGYIRLILLYKSYEREDELYNRHLRLSSYKDRGYGCKGDYRASLRVKKYQRKRRDSFIRSIKRGFELLETEREWDRLQKYWIQNKPGAPVKPEYHNFFISLDQHNKAKYTLWDRDSPYHRHYKRNYKDHRHFYR